MKQVRFKLIVPLLAMALLLFHGPGQAMDAGYDHGTTHELVAGAVVASPARIEVKEAYKVEADEYTGAVAAKSGFPSAGFVQFGLLAIVVAWLAGLFDRSLFSKRNFPLALFAAVIVWQVFFTDASVYALAEVIALPVANQIKALREEREAKVKEMDGLITLAESEKRDFKPEEQTRYDAAKKEIEALNARISRLDDKMKRELEEAAANGQGISPTGERRDISEKEKKDISGFSFLKVVRAAVSKDRLDGLEGEMATEARQEMIRAGASPNGIYQVPLVVLRNTKMAVEKRDMVAGTGTMGGYNIATELKGYIDALRETSRVTALGAEYITGAVGNVDMSRENAVFTPGWAATENANAGESSPTYTKVTFTPKRLAGFMDLSNQLLAQTAPGFENRIRNQILAGNGEAIDQGAINGAGSSGEPEGILQTSGIGSVVGGTDGAAPDRDDLIDLWKAVATAKGLKNALAYLSNPQVFAKLAKTKTDTGSGLFILDKSKEFMGYNFGVSNNVPSTLTKGTSSGVASAILFGNWNDLMIMQWGGLEILTDPYTQAIAGLTRIVVNTFVDIHVLRPGSFAAMKDALPA